MNHRAAPIVLSILAVFCVVSVITIVGCDKGTPVAPGGSILAISANPTQISLNGSSTITVVGRKPDGQPLNPGTEIRLTATNGSIPAIVLTDRDGNATATFKSNGIPGTATITAATGTGSGSGGTTTSDGTGSSSGSLSASVSIQVGIPSGSKPTVRLSVNPSTIPVNGTSTVTVIGRNADGSPAANQRALLTSTLGTLDRTTLTTGNDGTASTTLKAGVQAGTAVVTATLGSSDAVTQNVEIKSAILSVTADRTAVPEQATTDVQITATVTAFQGDPISGKTVTFRSDRGVLSATMATTDSNGNATVTLTVTAPSVDSDTTFQVTVTTPSGAGDPLSATLNITIQNTIR